MASTKLISCLLFSFHAGTVKTSLRTTVSLSLGKCLFQVMHRNFPIISLRQWSSIWGPSYSPPLGYIWQCVKQTFWFSQLRECYWHYYAGLRPGILNILQCAGQYSPPPIVWSKNVNVEIEEYCSLLLTNATCRTLIFLALICLDHSNWYINRQ